MKIIQGDVNFLADNNFGGVKIDSGSCFNDMQLWYDLIQDTGKRIFMENCHQGG